MLYRAVRFYQVFSQYMVYTENLDIKKMYEPIYPCKIKSNACCRVFERFVEGEFAELRFHIRKRKTILNWHHWRAHADSYVDSYEISSKICTMMPNTVFFF